MPVRDSSIFEGFEFMKRKFDGYDPKTPLTPLFPRGLSLERCEGDQGAELIEFTFDGRMWMTIIDSINSHHINSNVSAPIPLYHSHVMWSYVHVEERKSDGSVELSLRDVGPHIGCNYPVQAILYSVRNHPEGLTKPELLAATGTFVVNGEEKETIEYALDGAGHWTATKRFTRDELAARAGSDGNTICILLRFVLARSYFNLSKLLKKPPTVSDETASMVERILRGEKTPGTDWTITVGSHGGDSGLPLTYHVHSAAFNRISDNFKKACETGRSVDDLIVMKEKNHCIIPSLAPDDMPVFVSLAYGMAAPLPTNIGRLAVMGRALTYLINFDVMMKMLLPQWEWAVCEQALALDKRAHSSFAALPRLLLTVWAVPYGFMPVAKRVAIGVFADMVWLQTPPGGKLIGFMDVVIKALDYDALFTKMMGTVINSMFLHVEVVSAVRKIGLSTAMKEEEGAVISHPAPSAKPGLDAQTVVPIEDDGVKKEEEGAVISSDPSKPDLDASTFVPIEDDGIGGSEEKEGGVISHPAPPVKPDLDAPTVVPIEDDDIEGSEEESTKWQCTIS